MRQNLVYRTKFTGTGIYFNTFFQSYSIYSYNCWIQQADPRLFLDMNPQS